MTIPTNEMKEIVAKSMDLLNKLYDDTFKPTAKEIGALLCNITKTLFIPSYPFIWGAALYDRINKRIAKAVESVPEKIRVKPYPELFLDYLDKTRFLPQGSIVLEAFDRLLAAAMNKEKRNLVHPAFITILAQLSCDEIIIINKLMNNNFKFLERWNSNEDSDKIEIIKNEFPLDSLHNKDRYCMYYTHLHTLGLVDFLINSDESEYTPLVLNTSKTLKLTEFGKLFAQAVIGT